MADSYDVYTCKFPQCSVSYSTEGGCNAVRSAKVHIKKKHNHVSEYERMSHFNHTVCEVNPQHVNEAVVNHFANDEGVGAVAVAASVELAAVPNDAELDPVGFDNGSVSCGCAF